MVVEYYKNGNIKSKHSCKSVIKNGMYYKYDENGTIKFIENYKDDVLKNVTEYSFDNIYKNTFFNDNKKETIIYYRNGIIKDRYINENDTKIINKYNFNGEILYSAKYINNELKNKMIYANGVLRKIIDNNVSKTFKYYRNKNIESITTRDGIYENRTLHYENGNIHYIDNFKDGRRCGCPKHHGLCTEYHINGNKMSESHYKNGNLKGQSIGYYKSGNVQSKCMYDYGKRIDGIFYRENGNIKSYILFGDSECIQKHFYYYKNNNLKISYDRTYYEYILNLSKYNNGYRRRFYKNKIYFYF